MASVFNTNNILLIVINFSQIFLQFYMIAFIFRHKISWWIIFIYSAVVSPLLFQGPLVMFLIFSANTISFYFFIAKMNFKQAMLATSMQLFLSMLTRNIVTFIYFGLFYTLDRVYMRPASSVILLIILLLSWKYKININNLAREKRIFAVTAAMMAIAAAAYSNFVHHYIEPLPRVSQMLNAFWVTIMQLAVIFVIYILNRLTAEIEQREFYRIYTDTLEESLDNLSGYKHSHREMINTMLALSDSKKHAELNEFLHKQESDIRADINRCVINAELRDNLPFIYGNVLAMIAKCRAGDIRFLIEIPAKNIEVKTVDGFQLSRMVGNLLNNAYDAAKRSSKKEATLTISNCGKSRIRIVVTNSVDVKVDTANIFKKQYSTKEGHSGFGLYEIKSIVDRQVIAGFNVKVHVGCTEDTFTAELIV